MQAEKIYLGNVITMNEANPNAEAVVVGDGLIAYVGSKEKALEYKDDDTEVIDLGENSIYPGFLESHCHPLGAGEILDKDANADLSAGQSTAECVEILRDFINKHPGMSIYNGNSFVEKDVKPTAAMIDDICPDVPVVVKSADGHSSWLNTAAMKQFGIDKEAVKKYGEDLVRVDENGDPTGYISETPVFELYANLPVDKKTRMGFILKAQEFFFSKGYTGVYDAGIEIIDKNCHEYYKDLCKEGSLKLRTYAGSIIDEKCEDIKGAVEKIKKMQEDNNEYYKIIGVKAFSDGVVESHTAYLIDDYCDQAGYKGLQRMTDHKALTEIYTYASENDMSVHVHTVGDAAIKCNLDAMEEAVKNTGKVDNRNVLCHLQVVNENDIKRFASLKVSAAVGSLWAPKEAAYFAQEVDYLGKERAENAYPVKSFEDAGANVIFHSDFPVSPVVNIPWAVYSAEKRRHYFGTPDTVRGEKEAIGRYQALEALTKNVAYAWREESRLGSLEVGKLANMSVFSSDFIKDDIEKVASAELVCTIVDGEIVYKA